MNTEMYAKFEFCPQLKSLLEIKKITGKTGKNFDDIGAASTVNNLLALRVLCLEIKPKNTLEIGFAYGASCLAIASSYRDLNYLPSHQHTTIDPYQSTVWDNTGRLMVESANLEDYVDVRENFSYYVLPQLLAEGKNFDLIYIDGSHLFEDVFIDFYYSNKLLSQQGLILFDDSFDPHIRKVINFIDKNFSQTYEKLNLSYIHSGIKKIKYSLAVKLKKNQLTVYRKRGENERPWNTSFKHF